MFFVMSMGDKVVKEAEYLLSNAHSARCHFAHTIDTTTPLDYI